MNPVGPFTLTSSGMRSATFSKLEDAHAVANKRLAAGRRSVLLDRYGQTISTYEELGSRTP